MEDEVSVKVDMGPSTSVTGTQRIARSTPVFVADFSASWLSFIASVTIAHPIDTLRVRWQTFGQSPMHTVRADGVRSLFAGIGGPMVGLGPIIAVIFAINENVRDAARRSGRLRVVVDNATAPNGFAIPQNVFCTPFTVLPRSNVTMAEAFVAGLVAGSVVSVVLCPISVVRVQQQNSSRAGHRGLSVREVVSTLTRHEGVAGLYRANGLEMFMGGAGRGIYFATYETLKQVIGDNTVLGEHVFNDSAAAFITSFIWLLSLFPLEVIKTKLQADTMGVSPCQRRYLGSMRECARQTYRDGGLRGFYTGFALTLVRSLASSGTALPLYDTLRPRLRSLLGCNQ
jgi:solute carrier family 25 carnitine/acylcarnitine transporter 20/29